jgi:hypothetical protein
MRMIDVPLVAVGVVLIVAPIDAAVRSFVLPRGVPVAFSRAVYRIIRVAFNVIANARRSYEARDRVMALYGPIALLALPTVFLISVFFGFAFWFRAFGNDDWHDAFLTSGSSLFTLGFHQPRDSGLDFLVFIEAALGLGLVALLISYLPTIYNSFSRREVMVTGLAVRAGTPPTAWNLLRRAHLSGFLDNLDPTWASWEQWFQELSETHTSLAVLTFFRSPNAHRSWLTASGAVLDAAAMRLAVVDMPWTPEPQLCIRAGYIALREISDFYGIDYDPAPEPGDPISIAREEFDDVCKELEGAGVPLVADRDQAWRDFAGWRVNYDRVLTALGGLIMAPYAPWSSDRSARYQAPPLRHRRAARRQRERRVDPR